MSGLSRYYLAYILSFGFLLLAVTCVAEDVAKWGRFETSVQHHHSDVDPLRDVRLHAEWTRPDGKQLNALGFYDGEQTWRCRCMPDMIGRWTYRLTWADGATAGVGDFDCVDSELPGMLQAYQTNPIWFADGDCKPFLMRSFHVGDRFFASNWDDPADASDGDKREKFLKWLSARGYNTLSIASHYINRNLEGRGAAWETPQLWPIRPAEYRKLEAILEGLAERQIYVFPFAGFFGRGSSFPIAHDDQQLYVEYLTARLGCFYNGLYNVGGPEPLLPNRPYASFETIERWAQLIDEADAYGHMLSVHGQTGDDRFRGLPMLDFGTLQGPKTINRKQLSIELLRNHHPARPLYAQETLWAGNTAGHPNYSDEDIRKNALVILFSAAMINFGDMSGNSSSGFSGSMEVTDAIDSRHDIIHDAWNTFDKLPWSNTAPRQDLVDHGYCLADEGETYLVYLPEPGPVKIRTLGGPFEVKWIRAGTAEKSTKTMTENRQRDEKLSPPDDLGNWIAVLKSLRQPYTLTDGRVEIEAEDGLGEWKVVDTPTGKGIQDPGGGRMRYYVRFDQPGEYNVSLLAKQGPLGADKQNDVLLALSGQKLYGSDGRTRPDGMRSYGDWRWTTLPKGPGNHTPDQIRNGKVYFKVPKAGNYELEIAHRSSEFLIDRIRLERR